ncbi:rfbP protein [Vibrio cholerae]|uniref:RfbP protein n=1 Tax=Vibrio paracholerae TaxID=650003 RepID=A0ABD7FVU0_9VIBR|nr:rfbP protein [Vibrio cholerae]EGR1859677.1 rfbP protein [Vibrio cholerae]RBM68282.1 rfbP protein [Vibrio paracholerae]
MIKKPAKFAGFFVVIPKPPLLAVVIVWSMVSVFTY